MFSNMQNQQQENSADAKKKLSFCLELQLK
jgi:hypothetical protein